MVGDILQPTHLLFVFIVALLVLGPKRLPEVGRQLGDGIRDFRAAINGERHDHDDLGAPHVEDYRSAETLPPGHEFEHDPLSSFGSDHEKEFVPEPEGRGTTAGAPESSALSDPAATAGEHERQSAAPAQADRLD